MKMLTEAEYNALVALAEIGTQLEVPVLYGSPE